MAWGAGKSSAAGRPKRPERFKCAYCHASLTQRQGRLVKIRGTLQYIHAWHPKLPGE